MKQKMPKAISVPPPLNTVLNPGDVVTVKVTRVRLVEDQWTSIGTLSLGLGMSVELDGEEYSQLFSLDKEVLAGSIGRILVSVGIEDTDMPDFDKAVKRLVGKEIQVRNKGGKIYWYP